MLVVIHGRVCVRRGGRYFAVPNPLRGHSVADSVHAQQQVKGNWARVLSAHKTAHVIQNYRPK